MKEVILCKYGELILKGLNKSTFENTLLREVRRRTKHFGNFTVRSQQSTVYIEPEDENAEACINDVYDQINKIFGFSGICRAAACEKTLEAIVSTAAAYLPDKLKGIHTFKCESKRSDKQFPLSSPELSGEVGYALLQAMPELTVDVHNPDIIVRIEVREEYAYIHAGQDKGAGGMPINTAGKGLLLLSGGIDSPVAGYMMMKRGLTVDALHFESYPYTSEAAREKVFTLAKELTEYCGRIRVHVISLTHIQEVLRDTCDEDYFTLLLRRFMMRLASRCAEAHGCGCLITGESLGQVASQTLKAMTVTEDCAEKPVFRPCIGLDKDEIVITARKINTFDTSILPYEDCCTVFTPKHPRTQPDIEKVREQEKLIDVDALVEEAWSSEYTETFEQFD